MEGGGKIDGYIYSREDEEMEEKEKEKEKKVGIIKSSGFYSEKHCWVQLWVFPIEWRG